MARSSNNFGFEGPQRIVCLSTEAVDVLYRLNQQHRVVGISGFCVHPPQARREKPKVSAYTSAKVDKILALKPDLVLAFSDLQADLASDLARLGLEVHLFNQRTVEEILQAIMTLGRMVDVTSEARALVAMIDEHFQAIQETCSLKTQPRVYFEEWDDPMICGIAWVSELIALAGGEDVFAERAKAPEAKHRIITSAQEVIDKDPEIIIGSWCGKKFQPTRVASRAGFDQISAVKAQRLFEIKSADILQPGPTTLLSGLEQLARIIQGHS